MTGSLSNSSSSLLELTDEQDDSESSTDNTVASGEQGDIQLTCTTLQQFMAVEVCHRSIESDTVDCHSEFFNSPLCEVAPMAA
jgi:hypothetical protein